MTLPSFLVIGAAKSGTTSLMAYLGQHPQVFTPISKEPNYFALAGLDLPPKGPAPPQVLQEMLYNWSRTDLPAYTALFADAAPGQAVGEGSVRYLYFPEAPVRVQAMLPNTRIVAVLRDPVARLYSHYCMNRQYQLEPLSLTRALAAEDDRVAAGWGWDWHYVRLGLYARQLRRWHALFPPEQIAVFLYDELVADPRGVFARICTHIGVDPGFRPDMSRRGMVSTQPRWLWLDRRLNWPSALRRQMLRPPMQRATLAALRRLNRLNSLPVPRLDPALARQIAPRFAEDLADLADLLGREIPWYRG